MNVVLKDCGSFLSGRADEVVSRWFEACKHDEALGVVVAKLSQQAFVDDIPKAIDGLALTIRQGGEAYFTPSGTVLDLHSQHRWRQGFSLRQLIRDWGNLNKALVQEVDAYFSRYYQNNHANRALVFERLSDFITEALSESVRCFEALRRREAGGVANELQAIQDQFDETSSSRSRLLREATHDLRGGLSAIAGATAVLKFAEQPNPMFGDALESLDRGVESVKTMLDSLLDLSRLESGQDVVKLQLLDIVPVLQTISAEYRVIAKNKRLQLEGKGTSTLLVQTDPEKIRRITQNILINALEYTDKGKVSLSLHAEPERKRWVLSISDTGPGLDCTSPTSLAHELESDNPLEQSASSFSGEGIGLTIVKRLCEALSATLTVQSSAGHGTVFTLHFPLDYDKAVDQAYASRPDSP
ncbi:HAMP domain-containing sensor histidine kinase [Allohahella marinimesophila]|uniref:histidine kinase n=1 Tax=Allohahella marinimesophila TaxID=1054972 RepID=A0ABP7NHE3_9GAMM